MSFPREYESVPDVFDELGDDLEASEEWEHGDPPAMFEGETGFSDDELADEWLDTLKRWVDVSGIGRPFGFGLGWPGLATRPKLQKVIGSANKKIVKPAVARARRRTWLSPEKICWIQTVLSKASRPPLRSDGIYGPKTRNAVLRFQSRYRLRVDGIVGPETTGALLQLALRSLRLSSNRIDGRVGEETRQALRRFQSKSGLVPDGVLGPRTRAAMVSALGGRCVRKPTKVGGSTDDEPTGAGCRKAEYERLRKHCHSQLMSYLINCGLRFGLDQAKAIPMALGIVNAAVAFAEIPPLAVLVGIVGGIASAVLTARQVHDLAQCCEAVLMGYSTCVKNAKAATLCS